MFSTTTTSRTSRRGLRPALIGFGTLTAVAAVVLFAPLAAQAAEPGDDDFLGSAEDYAIISSDTITDTATHGTEVIGDVALTPGTDQQLLVVQVSGDIHVGDTDATTADSDLNTAYVILAGVDSTEIVGTVNLAARVTPYGAGVYFSASDLLLDGTMTLSGGADDVFIFQASTGSLTVGTGSNVILLGGAQACNVYWQVGSSATLGVDSTFVGTIVAATSISLLDGAQITGQLLAGAINAGAVTLDDNLIDAGSPCTRATEAQRFAATESTDSDDTDGSGGTGGTTGGGTSGGTSGGSTTASAPTATDAGPRVLATTGADVTPLLIATVVLLLAGAGALVASRRFRSGDAQ